ncbi:Spermidine/putrescine import ATP-binding protein PotA [Raoultella terrigena]|uniref:Spermidine/putrescine import ATP-binding protein PotA n=1 Tax=Raoultella terrigena TaxID=577 RepID=A0A3P8K013_RAOTE|nr:Spermidine/putrescine import ATP-binding protein PotA [Raoultella terrigena]
MLAGFEQPTAGQIMLDGVDLSRVPPYQRPINMMFQSYALFPHMTVEQNIAFGLKQDKLPKAEIASRVQEMLALVHMQEFAKRKPHQLSGGQRPARGPGAQPGKKAEAAAARRADGRAG